MNKKIIWVVLGIISLFSAWFAYVYFDKAIPLVHISITMDAQAAKQKAQELAQTLDWNLSDYDSAVLFESDEQLQAFVELEGGGKQAFIAMIDHGYYQPYLWKVRLFKEKEIFETTVYFEPDGKKNGFTQKLSENLPGADISKKRANDLAEIAAQDWGYDVKKYDLVEYNQEEVLSKRIDHSFVYERSDISLNKGLYRLRIVVSGDRVTEIFPYIKIPDEFNRRYAQMYATNTLLSTYAKGIAFLLYGFIFGLFGLYFLYRRRYLLLQQNRMIMVVVAILMGLLAFNKFALIWNHYVTTMSKSFFLLQTLATIGFGIILVTGVLGMLCCIAEALDRYVFSHHIQFFKLWSRDVASSYSVVQQTLLGYCLAAVGLGYVVAFSIIANSWGWWSPLSSLADPNILSMYVPSLTPSITAFFAGFSEELTFRALPIAGMLLIMRNSRHQRYWLVAIIIVQAIVFAAAHAFYPQQPAYYRIVELTSFYWLYGLCYYFFGLLPCIISHFVYDAVLMLIPIWISTLLFQKILGIFFIGIPVWIILIRYMQNGTFSQLNPIFYNASWKANVVEKKGTEYKRLLGASIASYAQPYMYVIGLVGMLLFWYSNEFKFTTPAVTISNAQAECIARAAIQDQFGVLGNEWTVTQQFFDAKNDNGNRFIWQEYGSQIYQTLQGSYVLEPYYVVKFVKFTGPVELRAERYEAWIAPHGSVLSCKHVLPESVQGADISEARAHAIAYDLIEQKYDLLKHDVKLVSCDTTKHEHRRDWKVIMSDSKNYTLDKGQARIDICIAGDQVVSFDRYVYAPEDWTRQEAERLSQNYLIRVACFWVMIVMYVLAMFIMYRSMGYRSFPIKTFAWIVGLSIVLKFVEIANSWKQTLFSFNTMVPFYNQISIILMSSMMVTIVSVLVVLILLIASFVMMRKGISKEFWVSGFLGIAIGSVIIGLFAFIQNFAHTYGAQMPLYQFMNYNYPALGIMINHYMSEVIYSGIFILSVGTIAHYCFEKYNYQWISLSIFLLSGISFVGYGYGGVDDVRIWIIGGIVWGLLWYLIHRFILSKNGEILIIILMTLQFWMFVPSALYRVYPTVIFDVVLSSAAMIGVSFWIVRRLQSEE